jgi:hemerythrin-like domain-containing protein
MNSVADRLTKDHQDLEALLRCLAEDADAPDCGTLEATWSAFEASMTRHLEAEERYLLPLLEASHPAVVERTRFDHARIRNLITALGIAVELHTARKPAILELIALLREHAKHEDEAIYPLAGDKASVIVEHRIAEMLRGALHRTSSAPRSVAGGARR